MDREFRLVDVNAPEIADYTRIRAAEFERLYKRSWYRNEVNRFDKMEGSQFLISLEDGVVTGGLRFVFRKNMQGERLPCECKDDSPNIQDIMPHLDLRKHTYCEVGALAADYNHPKTGHALTKEASRLINEKIISADFFVVTASENSIALDARMLASQMRTVIRTDLDIKYHGQPKHFLMATPLEGFNLTFDDMLEKGAVTSADSARFYAATRALQARSHSTGAHQR